MTDTNLHPVFKEILDSQLSMHSVGSSSSDEPESCPVHSVNNRRELYFAFMKEYNSLMGESEHQILKEEVEVLLSKYS